MLRPWEALTDEWMTRTFTFFSCACGVLSLSTTLLAGDAFALGPVTIEAGGKVGYATSPSSVSGAPNPLGIGLGGRAGLVLGDHYYLGGSLMYYLGGSEQRTVLAPGTNSNVNTISLNTTTLMYGGELGYNIGLLDLLTIRPQVGVGNATFNTSGAGPIPSQSQSNWYLEPGVTGLIGLGLLYVGADANVLVFPGLSNAQAAFAFDGQVGVKF